MTATDFFFDFIRQGGTFFMLPLIFFSILSVAVILERIVIYATRIVPSSAIIKKIEAAAYENDYAALQKEIIKNKTLAEKILHNALDNHKANNSYSLKLCIEKSADRYVDLLATRLWLLRAIGHIAPLLGLMGTVVGLARSFNTISDSGLSQKSVAGGISMALITTITGLAVALPTLFADYCFRAWADRQHKKLTHLLTCVAEQWRES